MEAAVEKSAHGERLVGDGIAKSAQCRICGTRSEFFDEAKILQKYLVAYFRCDTCGFVQTEEPYWLGEAYASAISRLDTGILDRNISNRRITTAILNLLFPKAQRSLDFGAGHGIFVRLMRDSGFDFSWQDLYATNDYARGFEYDKTKVYDFLTAFEVLEHLADPLDELSSMMSLSPNVFVSTEILPEPAPKVSDWWYYGANGGQHISFFTSESLHLIARKFGRHLFSCGAYHLFTTEPKNKSLFRLAVTKRAARVLNAFYRRPSLTKSDFDCLSASNVAAKGQSSAQK